VGHYSSSSIRSFPIVGLLHTAVLTRYEDASSARSGIILLLEKVRVSATIPGSSIRSFPIGGLVHTTLLTRYENLLLICW